MVKSVVDRNNIKALVGKGEILGVSNQKVSGEMLAPCSLARSSDRGG